MIINYQNNPIGFQQLPGNFLSSSSSLTYGQSGLPKDAQDQKRIAIQETVPGKSDVFHNNIVRKQTVSAPRENVSPFANKHKASVLQNYGLDTANKSFNDFLNQHKKATQAPQQESTPVVNDPSVTPTVPQQQNGQVPFIPQSTGPYAPYLGSYGSNQGAWTSNYSQNGLQNYNQNPSFQIW